MSNLVAVLENKLAVEDSLRQQLAQAHRAGGLMGRIRASRLKRAAQRITSELDELVRTMPRPEYQAWCAAHHRLC